MESKKYGVIAASAAAAHAMKIAVGTIAHRPLMLSIPPRFGLDSQR